MKKKGILDDISKESLKQIIPCFKPIKKKYSTGEPIMTYSNGDMETLALLWKGSAKLEFINEQGEIFLLETYEEGDIFGEIFSLPLDTFQYTVTASSEATVLFIDYAHVISPCNNLCQHHSQIISNLFVMSTQKSQELSLYVSILGQPSTRTKILTYLKYVRSKINAGENQEFTIPMTLSKLASYLHVDRSAMMREIKSMNSDGIIESQKCTFKILE